MMAKFGPVTLEHVKNALRDLGGEANWSDIFDKVTENRNGDYSYYLNHQNYKNTTFQVIQTHCPDYQKYKGPTHFKKIRRNRFRLAGKSEHELSATTKEIPKTPIAVDIKEPVQSERTLQETYRILRDTKLAREVKLANNYRCQICNKTIQLTDGLSYAEAHHVKPLGSPHNGPDIRGNILCVCPNHHVLLDYGVIKLNREDLKNINEEFIQYHNENIFKNE